MHKLVWVPRFFETCPQSLSCKSLVLLKQSVTKSTIASHVQNSYLQAEIFNKRVQHSGKCFEVKFLLFMSSCDSRHALADCT